MGPSSPLSFQHLPQKPIFHCAGNTTYWLFGFRASYSIMAMAVEEISCLFRLQAHNNKYCAFSYFMCVQWESESRQPLGRGWRGGGGDALLQSHFSCMMNECFGETIFFFPMVGLKNTKKRSKWQEILSTAPVPRKLCSATCIYIYIQYMMATVAEGDTRKMTYITPRAKHQIFALSHRHDLILREHTRLRLGAKFWKFDTCPAQGYLLGR